MKTMKNIASQWIKNLRGLRSDERGAESSEVILVLVLLVIGMLGAWRLLKEKITKQAECTGNVIENANSSAAQC